MRANAPTSQLLTLLPAEWFASSVRGFHPAANEPGPSRPQRGPSGSEHWRGGGGTAPADRPRPPEGFLPPPAVPARAQPSASLRGAVRILARQALARAAQGRPGRAQAEAAAGEPTHPPSLRLPAPA